MTLGDGSFDPVIPQMFAESLFCLGRSQAGSWRYPSDEGWGLLSGPHSFGLGETDRMGAGNLFPRGV
jgi:hypothetical protein